MSKGSIRNAIIFCGNTGVGKSYICNRIFEIHGVATRFKSSETGSIQHGTIDHDGKNFTIVNTPGFIDNYDSGKTIFFNKLDQSKTAKVDGENMCKLVAALESCQEISAIGFIFTDHFSKPHSIWFNRIKKLLTSDKVGNIILVHNKLGPLDMETSAKNAVEVNKMIGGGGKVEYVWISSGGENIEFENLITTVEKLTPFQLSNFVVPKICYKTEEIGEQYDEVIAETAKKEGEIISQPKKDGHYITETHESGRRYILFGPKEKVIML